MGSKRSYNVAINELSVYLSMEKFIKEDVNFVHEPRNSKKSPYGFHFWESSYILSSENDTIDGLLLHLKSQLILDEWYHSFALAYRYNRMRNFIRHLEVYPSDYLSHRENGLRFYGTHIHELNKTHQDLPADHERFDWHDWMKYFCAHTNIKIEGRIVAPNEGSFL